MRGLNSFSCCELCGLTNLIVIAGKARQSHKVKEVQSPIPEMPKVEVRLLLKWENFEIQSVLKTVDELHDSECIEYTSLKQIYVDSKLYI